MAYDFQVVIDSHDPHVLAEWWAEAIGWAVEPTDEDFIRKMVAEGYAREEDTTTHRGKLVWKEGAAIRHPDGLDSGVGRRGTCSSWSPRPRRSRTGCTSTSGWARRTSRRGARPARGRRRHRVAPWPAGPALVGH